MNNLEKLQKEREKLAKEYQLKSVKWEERKKIKKIKDDIKKIKAATTRAKWGLPKDKLMGNTNKTGDIIIKSGKFGGKLLMAIMGGASDLAEQETKRKRGKK